MKNVTLLISFLAFSFASSAQCFVQNQVLANVTCFGQCNGIAQVIASGGTPPFTYSWTPTGGNNATASNLCAGTYTVVAVDAAGCTTFTTVTITQPSPLSVSICAQSNANCSTGCNGSAVVCAIGSVPPYTYQWSPAGGTGQTATNLCAGNYTVTVTDSHGC